MAKTPVHSGVHATAKYFFVCWMVQDFPSQSKFRADPRRPFSGFHNSIYGVSGL